MAQTPAPTPFQDRRSTPPERPGGPERRQFANSYRDLSPDARELAQAIDRYKLEKRRRLIDFEEMLSVLRELGYRKTDAR